MLTRRKILISASALALSGEPCARASLAEPLRAADRALPGRRRRGRDRAHRRQQAHRDVGPAGADREQGRRRRQHRVGRGREVAARRLHDVSRRRIPHHQSARLSEALLRSDRGPHSRSRAVVQYPTIVALPNSSPAKTVQEFIAYAKANPGRTFGTPGHGTGPHLAGELFKRAAGIELTHVPYRGAAPGAERSHPRPHQLVLQQHRAGGAADAAGPGARPRGHDRAPLRRRAGRADHRGVRPARLRRARLVRDLRAGEIAARDRREDERRHQRGARRSRR